jgi:TDG/mug DNA glycosylase family protein
MAPRRRDRQEILPDLLLPGLEVVFCGTAPGTVSAAQGAYYAHPQNKFWRALHASGLTPRLLDPTEFILLPTWRIGLTDIAKHVCGMDKELPPQSLGRDAVAALIERIALVRPRILAFTSLTGGRRVLGPKANFGEQSQTLGPTRLWILPSPSPAAHWNWDERVWLALGKKLREGG